MTVTASSPSVRRPGSAAGHVYTVPVVRELPSHPAAAGSASLW
jgi:hypothetical protein